MYMQTRTLKNWTRLDQSITLGDFIVAQLFRQDNMNHTAKGPRLCNTVNASSLPLPLEPAWPPTKQQRLISEAYNCRSHAVNLTVFTGFLIETKSPYLQTPTMAPIML